MLLIYEEPCSDAIIVKIDALDDLENFEIVSSKFPNILLFVIEDLASSCVRIDDGGFFLLGREPILKISTTWRMNSDDNTPKFRRAKEIRSRVFPYFDFINK